jgi:hypothetical protein
MFGTNPRGHPVYKKLSYRYLRRVSSSKMWRRFVRQLVLSLVQEQAAYLSECKILSHYIFSSILRHICSTHTHTHTKHLCKYRCDLPVPNFKFHTKLKPLYSLNECCSTLTWPNKMTVKSKTRWKQKSEEELSYNTFYPGLVIANMKPI